MGYSSTEYAEFTEPPTEMSSHGFHRSAQMLGCAVLPQNSQNSQNLAAWVWQGCHTLLHLCASVLICGRLFSARSFCAFRAFCGNIFPPTEFTESTEPPTGMSSHGFHGFTQILRVRCSPTEFVSVGMAGMPYPPTSVRIRAICGSPFSARGSVYSVHSVGASSPLVRLVQQRLLHPLAESTEVVCKSHPFTSNPAFCMSSQYCGYDFVTTCGSLMRSPGNTMAAGANAIAMRWSS